VRKKVLVVCFTFPPYEGIGGRRWAKFCRELAARYDISVLAADLSATSTKSTNWLSDLDLYKDNIFYLPHHYPKVLLTTPKSIAGKLAYRYQLLNIKKKCAGNYYDKSVFWHKSLIPYLEKVLPQTDTLIVSGAPFKMAYDIIQLKKQFNKVKFIFDVRDPWTQNRTSYGYDALEEKRKQKEFEMERECALNYDHILTVAPAITKYFIQLGRQQPTSTLYNGYDDKEELPAKKAEEFQAPYVFAFTGTAYGKALPAFTFFNEALNKLKINHPVIYDRFSFLLIGDIHSSVRSVLSEQRNVQIMPTLPKKEANEILGKSLGAMLFLTNDLNFSFSTKFYEYIRLEKPILVFASGGYTQEFVEEQKIGLALSPENCYDKLLKLHQAIENKDLKFNPEFNKEQFSISSLTKQLQAIL
jgi:hypothetical protein